MALSVARRLSALQLGRRHGRAAGPRRLQQVAHEPKEFAPLVKFGDSPLTSIAYVSKEYLSHGSEINIDESMKWMDSMLADSPLDNVQKAKVRKDFRGFLEDVKKYTPEVGGPPRISPS